MLTQVIAGIRALSVFADAESYNDIIHSIETATGILRLGVMGCEAM
jgi:hypothetical protein